MLVAARRRRTDGQGPDRHPRPVAAAHLAAPEAAHRGRPRRPPPGGGLGLLPPDRQAGDHGRSRSDSRSRRRSRRSGPAPGPRAAGRGQARARRGGAPLLRRECRRLGHDPRAARRRGRGRGGDASTALGERRFDSLLDLGTGTGRMLELLAPLYARGVGIDASTGHARGRPRQSRPGRRSPTRRCASATSTTCRSRATPSTSSPSTRCCTTSTIRSGRSPRRRGCCVPGGRLLIVDFAPHELEFLRERHAHRRLGFAPRRDAPVDRGGRASPSTGPIDLAGEARTASSR